MGYSLADFFLPLWRRRGLRSLRPAGGETVCAARLSSGGPVSSEFDHSVASQTHLSHGLNKSNDFVVYHLLIVRAGTICLAAFHSLRRSLRVFQLHLHPTPNVYLNLCGAIFILPQESCCSDNKSFFLAV